MSVDPMYRVRQRSEWDTRDLWACEFLCQECHEAKLPEKQARLTRAKPEKAVERVRELVRGSGLTDLLHDVMSEDDEDDEIEEVLAEDEDVA